MAELLGDVGILLEKQEKLLQEIPKLRKSLVATVEEAGDKASEKLLIDAEAFRKTFSRENDAAVKELRDMANAVTGAAMVINRSSKSFRSAAFVTAFAAGLIGGILVVTVAMVLLFPQVL